MLNELSRYENLGTPKIFHELFTKLTSDLQAWTDLNIKEYFYNKIIDDFSVFDGCLPFAKAVGAIIVDNAGFLSLNPVLVAALSNENHLRFRFVGIIVEALKSDDAFHQIFCPQNLTYDFIHNHIQIERGAFQFRFANFRHLLVGFEFLLPHPDAAIQRLIINHKYKKLFDLKIVPEIKKRELSMEQLQKLLTQQQINGKAAEEFVLKFEQTRLALHPSVQKIENISDYHANAGFDIVSFESITSTEHDRFIEVKSYHDNIGFHWSRNEMNEARIRKNRYFLYLVDRNQMNQESYAPFIIQNPHQQILDRPEIWEKRIEDYFISQLKA